MMASVRAEVIRLGRWPAAWVLSGTWLLLNLVFGYVFPYLSYRDGGGFAGPMTEGASSAALLAELLPDQAPVTMVQGLPMFGGALMLILGAMAVGGGYGWGTWKTIFITGPRRHSIVVGTLGALAGILLGLVLATLAVDLIASLVVASLENQAVIWPGAVDVLQGLGTALLIGGMWIVAGALIGTLARGPALAVGLGLLWALVVENLLRGVGALLGPIEAITNWLPGTAAGSLAAAIGAATQNQANGTPGVMAVLGGPAATLTLGAYVVVFAALAMILTQRRDVAG